jgi:tRNA(fMet)-specific endonuclease VapC
MLDAKIAAHAVAVDATLVTHDKAFVQLPGGMPVVEDWRGK